MLPVLRRFAPLIGRAAAGVTGSSAVAWEELGVRLAVSAAAVDGGSADTGSVPLNAAARVTRAVRLIERHPDAALTLTALARDAGLSPYHFLRTFERITGVTPHQYILRARLREAAALRLADAPGKIVDVALDCGFGDVSNFNRAFRAELGTTSSRGPSIALPSFPSGFPRPGSIIRSRAKRSTNRWRSRSVVAR